MLTNRICGVLKLNSLFLAWFAAERQLMELSHQKSFFEVQSSDTHQKQPC